MCALQAAQPRLVRTWLPTYALRAPGVLRIRGAKNQVWAKDGVFGSRVICQDPKPHTPTLGILLSQMKRALFISQIVSPLD